VLEGKKSVPRRWNGVSKRLWILRFHGKKKKEE
jgi:hypothetical protein